MYCEKCGAEVKKTDKFCEKCGNILNPSESEKGETPVINLVNNKKEIKDVKPRNKKIFLGFAIAVTLICGIVIARNVLGTDVRKADKNFPAITKCSVSSKNFEFTVDRAWATDTIKCPKDEQKNFDSKYLTPVDDNAVFFIVEYTFTNTSNQAIDERPIIQLVDDMGEIYNRDETTTVYVKHGGTSPDYMIYDEGVQLDQAMASGLSLKGQCTFVIAKNRLNESGAIICSLPQNSANNTIEWLTGFNFGLAESVSVPLSGVIVTDDKQAVNVNTENAEREVLKETEFDVQAMNTEVENSQEDLKETEDLSEPYIVLPNSSTEKLSNADVSGLTEEELRYAKNEIYARHGRKFKDAGLQTWFEAQSWYNGIIAPEKFSEDMLTQVEKDNVNFIQQVLNTGSFEEKAKALSGRYEAVIGGQGNAELEIVYSSGDDTYTALLNGLYLNNSGYIEGSLEPWNRDVFLLYVDEIQGPVLELQYDGEDQIEVQTLSDETLWVNDFCGFDGKYLRVEEYPLP